MTLLIRANEVEAASDMPALIDALESGIREQVAGLALVPPRINIPGRDGSFRIMAAVLNGSGIMGFKAFHGSARTGARYLVGVFDQDDGELLALVDGHFLTAARTGATTAVATRLLARENASTVAVIGSGLEARTNLNAVCAVRDISEVRIFSPRSDRRERFAFNAERVHRVRGIPCRTAEESVDGADIVIVATNTAKSSDPIAFRGEWMVEGTHVNTVGSTSPHGREVDIDTFARADIVVVDSAVQATGESGDLIAAAQAGVLPALVDLGAVLAGSLPGRSTPAQSTVFKSVGTALQDVVAAFVIYEAVRRSGGGLDVGVLLDHKTL